MVGTYECPAVLEMLGVWRDLNEGSVSGGFVLLCGVHQNGGVHVVDGVR